MNHGATEKGKVKAPDAFSGLNVAQRIVDYIPNTATHLEGNPFVCHSIAYKKTIDVANASLNKGLS
jgi:hypothetical protein